MDSNDSIQVTRPGVKLLFNFANLVISSVGFILSVVAHCIATFMPFTQRIPEGTVIRASAAMAITTTAEESSSEVIVSLFRTDSQTPEHATPIAVRRRPRMGSAPGALSMHPPATASMIVLTGDERLLCSSPGAIELSFEDAYHFHESAHSCEGSASEPQPPLFRRPTLAQRLPTVFRKHKRSVDEKEDASRSESPRPHTPTRLSANSRGVSPVSVLRTLTKREPAEPADAHGRVPYVPNPDDCETLRTTFVNPFKPKRKSPSTSPVSTPPSRAFTLPDITDATSKPSVSSHRRNRSLVSFLHNAVRPSQHVAADSRSPSPHRGSFSSCSTTCSSSSASSASSSRRSFSFSSNGESERELAKRTQPYGPPYYAAMPLPRVQRSTSRRMRTGNVKPINEDFEPAMCTEHGVARLSESSAQPQL